MSSPRVIEVGMDDLFTLSEVLLKLRKEYPDLKKKDGQWQDDNGPLNEYLLRFGEGSLSFHTFETYWSVETMVSHRYQISGNTSQPWCLMDHRTVSERPQRPIEKLNWNSLMLRFLMYSRTNPTGCTTSKEGRGRYSRKSRHDLGALLTAPQTRYLLIAWPPERQLLRPLGGKLCARLPTLSLPPLGWSSRAHPPSAHQEHNPPRPPNEVLLARVWKHPAKLEVVELAGQFRSGSRTINFGADPQAYQSKSQQCRFRPVIERIHLVAVYLWFTVNTLIVGAASPALHPSMTLDAQPDPTSQAPDPASRAPASLSATQRSNKSRISITDILITVIGIAICMIVVVVAKRWRKLSTLSTPVMAASSVMFVVLRTDTSVKPEATYTALAIWASATWVYVGLARDGTRCLKPNWFLVYIVASTTMAGTITYMYAGVLQDSSAIAIAVPAFAFSTFACRIALTGLPSAWISEAETTFGTLPLYNPHTRRHVVRDNDGYIISSRSSL